MQPIDLCYRTHDMVEIFHWIVACKNASKEGIICKAEFRPHSTSADCVGPETMRIDTIGNNIKSVCTESKPDMISPASLAVGNNSVDIGRQPGAGAHGKFQAEAIARLIHLSRADAPRKPGASASRDQPAGRERKQICVIEPSLNDIGPKPNNGVAQIP